MQNAEWRLTHPDGDLTFGVKRPIWNITAPELGDVEITSADSPRARADGVDFGVDYFGGRTISFDIGVTGTDEATTRANAARLAKLWRADTVRKTPGAVAELRSRYRNSERVVFGRPRRFAANYADARRSNFVAVTADFATADDHFYSAETFSASVGLVPQSPTGGLVAPLRAPLVTTRSSDRSVGLEVVSELPVWPVITLSGGQVTNPVVEVIGLWRIELLGTIPEDRTVTIDTQPWARTVLLDGGASLGGQLSRTSTRLRNAAIPPGTYELAFRGQSSTNLTTAALTWRSAYPTP